MKKILVTEDEVVLLNVIVNILKKHFPAFEIFSASSGQEALRLIQSHHFDMFLLDLGLPDLSGLDVAKTLRANLDYYTTPIIFITADPHFELEAFRKTHCHGYMVKPIKEDDLVGMVHKLMTSKGTEKTPDTKVLLTFKSHKQWVALGDIYYIQAQSKKLRFYFKSTHLDYPSKDVDQVFEKLKEDFVPISKKIYVNKTHVKAVSYVDKWVELFDHPHPLPIDAFYVRLLHSELSQNFVSKRKLSDFDASVEFDLLQSDFGQGVMAHYSIKRMIYDGQNSQIYLLEAHDTGALVCLKAMPLSEGMVSDLAPLKALDVKGVSKLLDWGKGNEYTYTLKPYYEGTSLSEWVLEKGPLPESKAWALIEKIKNILTQLHLQNPPVIFRDVKPSNIIIQPSEEVVLVDIETARRVKNEGASDTLIIGTRGYAPPEQYGFAQTGVYSDIYALGATAYFMATGEAPSYDDIFSTNEPFKGLSKAYCDFIRDCMRFDPKKRSWGSVPLTLP